MAVRTRIESISRDIDLIIDEMLSPEAQAKAFAVAAREARDEAQAINRSALGRDAEFETIVDGRVGASEDTAKVPGRIVYDFDLGNQVLTSIYEMLLSTAPIESGDYRKSIRIYVDGVEVSYAPDQIEGAEEVVFTTVSPYARKLEGAAATKDNPKRYISPQAPDGVFQAVALLARKRFGNIANVKYTYQPIVGGSTALESWARTTKQTRMRFKGGSERRTRAREDWLRRQPAIIVTFRG